MSRLVCILFPEPETLVPSLHLASVYALLEAFLGTAQIARIHLTRLSTLLETVSKGRYKRDIALKIWEAAKHSSVRTCQLNPPSGSSGNCRDCGDWGTHSAHAQWAPLSHHYHPRHRRPHGRYDSGWSGWLCLFWISRQAIGIHRDVTLYVPVRTTQELLSPYGKARFPIPAVRFLPRGKYVCHWNPVFAAYLTKKRAEEKHYNVALSMRRRNWSGCYLLWRNPERLTVCLPNIISDKQLEPARAFVLQYLFEPSVLLPPCFFRVNNS